MLVLRNYESNLHYYFSADVTMMPALLTPVKVLAELTVHALLKSPNGLKSTVEVLVTEKHVFTHVLIIVSDSIFFALSYSDSREQYNKLPLELSTQIGLKFNLL